MDESKTILHLLVGKICSGKSTLAASLGRSTKTVIITEDEWLSKLFGDDMHGIGDYIRYSAKLRTIMEPHLVTLLRSDLSVVLDFPANTLEMRAWMRGIYEAANCGHQLHYLVSSDEDCKKGCTIEILKATTPSLPLMISSILSLLFLCHPLPKRDLT